MAKKVEKGTGIWRLLINPPLNGYLNMALDELLLEEAKRRMRPPTLRFYEWEGDWISFGYFQTPARAFNIQAAEKTGVASVRRLTGGRAVLHSEDLTYAVVAGDAEKEGLGSSLKETYRQVACALSSGFARVGLPVGFSFRAKKNSPPMTEGPKACFLTLSDYEISSAGKKLVGSAQRRDGSAFLQHGSIPLTLRNRELAEQVLAEERAVPKFRTRYAAVEGVAGRRIPTDVLVEALRAGFAEVFGVVFEAEEFSASQRAAAQRLSEKYASSDWNERKNSAARVGSRETVLG